MNDEIFEVLSDVHRRKLLVALLRKPTRNPELQALEGVGVIEDPARTKIQLRHVHLPKLVAMDFVRWDEETDIITTGPRYEQIRPILELLDTHRDRLPEGWP